MLKKSLVDEQAKAIDLENKIAELEPKLHSARQELSSNTEKLGEAESKMAKWQDCMGALSEKISEPAQIVEIEASRIEHLNNHLEQLAERKNKLLEDLHRFNQHKESRQSADLQSRLNETSTALQTISPQIANLTKKIGIGRDTAQSLGVKLEARARKFANYTNGAVFIKSVTACGAWRRKGRMSASGWINMVWPKHHA